MIDDLSERYRQVERDPQILGILNEVCAATGMGFAAVAHVTEERWIACQVVDNIDFGLDPGDELDIKTTLCGEIRRDGNYIVIDHVELDEEWRTHPAPRIYGFQSYASFPIVLDDGSFFGTLCAIDPRPNKLRQPTVVTQLQALTAQVATILSG